MVQDRAGARDLAVCRRRLPPAWAGALVVTCLGASSGPLRAQTVLVRVVDSATSLPVVGAMAALLDSDGTTVHRALTDGRGRALFVGLPAAAYGVRVEMIGMSDVETDRFELDAEASVTRLLRMTARPIELTGLDVAIDGGRCVTRPGEDGLLVARLWDEVRKALANAALTDERGAYRYETMRYEREISRRTGAIVREDRTPRAGWMRTPYESHPADDLVENGFVQRRGGEEWFMAPDAAVLVSAPFLDTHCFHLAPVHPEIEGVVGLGFRPTGDNRRVPNIAGILWVDAESAELRWLDYTYQHLEPERTAPEVGGRVEFRRMPDGTWIVPGWEIRMPVMAVQTDFRGQRLPVIRAFKETGGIVLDIRRGGGRRVATASRSGGIEGVVRDSLGHPVPGVGVSLEGSKQTVFTDPHGRFGLTRLPEGRYAVLVSHPRLAEAGYDPEPIGRDVLPGQVSPLEVHLPSLSDILFDQCRGVPREEGTAILVGTVVERDGDPVAGAPVAVTWNAYDFGGVLSGRRARDLRETPLTAETTTDSLGRYRFCDVPTGRPLRLRAAGASPEGAAAADGNPASVPVELTIPDLELGAVRVLELAADTRGHGAVRTPSSQDARASPATVGNGRRRSCPPSHRLERVSPPRPDPASQARSSPLLSARSGSRGTDTPSLSRSSSNARRSRRGCRPRSGGGLRPRRRGTRPRA